MYSCKKLWEWASASNRFLHTSSLHKKLKLGLWECYIECNKCEISSHGQQNLLTFSVNILNNCSGMPAPRTSQCQDSLDSLSGWMACFPVNTAYRAARAPFFFLAVRWNQVVLEGEKPCCFSATQDYSVYAFEAFTLPSQALPFMKT